MKEKTKLKNTINRFRLILHKKLKSKEACNEEIVEISQKLDSLILEYYRNEEDESKDCKN